MQSHTEAAIKQLNFVNDVHSTCIKTLMHFQENKYIIYWSHYGFSLSGARGISQHRTQYKRENYVYLAEKQPRPNFPSSLIFLNPNIYDETTRCHFHSRFSLNTSFLTHL